MKTSTASGVLARGFALLVGLLIASCGGVDSGGTGGAALVAVGPIGGLGSIIVNGTRFDESAAAITDEDGQVVGRERLTLGVLTIVEGTLSSVNGAVRLAVATSVRVGSDLIGDVQAIDRGAKTFVVLDQTVRVTAATAFDTALPQGIDSLSIGRSLQVYGPFDPASGKYVATRVELRPQPAYRMVRGRIDAVDTGLGLARLGALSVDVSGLTPAEATNVVAGATVRLQLQPGSSPGSWRATSASPSARRLADSDDGSVEGRISSFVSLSSFNVDGVTIDASGATFPDGSALATGTRVSIEGVSRGGVLVAKEVRIEGDEDASNSIFELHGPIDTLDTTLKVLVVRGVTVDYSGAVAFVDGTEADLARGRQIEVKGTLRPDGVGLAAQLIEFEDK